MLFQETSAEPEKKEQGAPTSNGKDEDEDENDIDIDDI